MIVLDASAGVDFLLRLEPGYTGVRNRIVDVEGNVHVPHLFDLEVVHVFRRYERRGLVPDPRLERAFGRLQGLRLVRYPHIAFLEQVWRLRANVTTYDAAYLALAEALAAPLVTTDGRLSRVPGLRAVVEFHGEPR
jgi:predicted nucleic acid-binding protein